MPSHSRFAVFLRVVLLPLGLVATTVAGLGSYCEANDDLSLAWLFSGVIAARPVASVPLYFHGYGHALAAAYAAAPAVPWFGLLLGALLSAATVLVFAVLDKLLRARGRPGLAVLVLVGFFGLAWLEHWQWFSYVRVALLLAGAGVLFAAQRPGRRGALAVGLAALLAAWLMRPSLAVLGLAAALPAAGWLAGSWRRAAPVLGSGAVLLALATALAAGGQTPEQAHAQARDRYFARILDFDQLRPQSRTPADSLGTAAVGLWLMGDSALVNEALCQRAYAFNARDFVTHEVPAKLRLRAGLLLRDYFPLLLALVATGLVATRRARFQFSFWLVQAGFAGALVFLAGILKLPPRLELPLLDFWLLANLAFVFRPTESGKGRGVETRPAFSPGLLRAGAVAAVATVLLYGAKTWHRRQVLSQEQAGHLQTLRAIEQAAGGRQLILAGANDLLKSLSPFGQTVLDEHKPVLQLSGWTSHDPSQAALRQALSGTSDQTECLRRLALGAGPPSRPLWVLSPEAAGWLHKRWQLANVRAELRPRRAIGSDSTLQVYEVRPVKGP
ncbi:hypothetical protein [Hymenobacter ruricola]|uniref:Glycosyltransferase RgtA/B/C/D-like domain-containing protein n=1 Tax=Hymenobacter ruricola TaxID=2791023 RepID=A0ABS0I170_9BACT|nr:hypothetical protein [Hymenobacter ruricola]MBF9220551.1 hypothetical protein [Hymenobacter ruricola]